MIDKNCKRTEDLGICKFAKNSKIGEFNYMTKDALKAVNELQSRYPIETGC